MTLGRSVSVKRRTPSVLLCVWGSAIVIVMVADAAVGLLLAPASDEYNADAPVPDAPVSVPSLPTNNASLLLSTESDMVLLCTFV